MKLKPIVVATLACAFAGITLPAGARSADDANRPGGHLLFASSIPKTTLKALKKASALPEFLDLLRKPDADGLKALLVSFHAAPDIQIAIHSSPVVGQTTDFVNGPCLQYGWYYTHSGFPPPGGSDHITYGCIKWGSSGSGQFNGGIWYPD